MPQMIDYNPRKAQLFRKIVSLIVTVLMCMALVSCKNSAGEEPDSRTEPQDDPVPEIQYLPIRVTGSLHDSMALEYGAKTAHGYYEIIDWPDFMLPADHGYTRYGNIVYTDYATCQKVFLCNVPGCAHNSPDCTSFVQYTRGAVLFTDYSETHLYLLSYGYHGDDMKPEDVGTVTEMNMDGSERRTVCTLSSEQVFLNGTMQIASDEYFYQEVGHVEMMSDPNKNNAEVPVEQSVIERIWFADGRREEVFKLRNGFEGTEILYSVWNDEDLIITSEEYSDDTLQLYRVRLSQAGELIERIGPLSNVGYYSDRFIITAEEKDQKATVTAKDYATGEVLTIEDVPAESSMPGRAGIYNRDGYKVNWRFFDDRNEIEKTYILDFSEGTFKEFTLLLKNAYDKRAIVVAADAGDDYLVAIKAEASTRTLTDLQGIPHSFDYIKAVCALISKEDYWNCVPNYRIIEDKLG